MVKRGVNRRAVLAGAGAAATSLATGVRVARAADPVKVGVLFPLTGNAAAAGQASKAAVEVAADIVNNAHPELGNIPLAKDAGLPGLGGAKLELDFIDHQGNPSVAQQQALRLINAGQGACAVRRLPVVLHVHRDAGRRALRHSVRGRRFSGAEHHRPRLQMGVPRHADRDRLRLDLHALLRRHEEGRPARSARSRSSTRTPITAPRSPRRSKPPRRRTISRSRSAFPTARARPTSRRRCCSSRTSSPTW